MSKQRYVIMLGQVFRWEEKAPFVESGKSVEGAVEYDLDTGKCKCHECGEWYSRLDIHTSRSPAHPSPREYKIARRLQLSRTIGLTRKNPHAKLHPGMRPGALSREIIQRGVASRRAFPYRSHEKRNEQGTCLAQIITHLQAKAAELGRTPRQEDIAPKILYSVANRFGTFSRALAAAGLELNRVYRSKESLIEILRDFYVLNQRLPGKKDWGTGRLPFDGVYSRNFGSLPAAYAAAGLRLVAQEQAA